jgi:hypothetical protein
MRRIIVVIATVIVAHLTVSAQTDFKKIIINDADLARNQNLMTVSMDFDFSAFNVESNRAVLLTPYIIKGEVSVALPALGFYGRDRYFYYIRNDKQLTSSEIKDAYLESKMPEYIPYIVNVPFEKWMNGADLVIERKVFGCCGKLEEEDFCRLDRYKVFIPEYIYVKPPKPGGEADLKIESASATTGTIWDATKKPTSLYKKAVITTYAGSKHYWNHPSACVKQGTKSIFDPCPPGWEVAPTDAYLGLVKNTTGTATARDNSDGKYAVKFLYADEPGNVLPPKYLWGTQDQVNDGAWVISASGKLTDAGEPAHPTYYPNAGFIQQSGMKEMVGLGDLWCADQKTADSGSFLYLGYSIEVVKDGLLQRCPLPAFVLKNSDDPAQFTKDFAFSVRCIKRAQ